MDAREIAGANVVIPSVRAKELVETAKTNQSGVQCCVMHHCSKGSFDLCRRKALRNILLVNVKAWYLTDHLADHPDRLLKLFGRRFCYH